MDEWLVECSIKHEKMHSKVHIKMYEESVSGLWTKHKPEVVGKQIQNKNIKYTKMKKPKKTYGPVPMIHSKMCAKKHKTLHS